MLDPWIIEEIKRREREDEEARRLPLQLPVPDRRYEEPPVEDEASPPAGERGVVVIDL